MIQNEDGTMRKMNIEDVKAMDCVTISNSIVSEVTGVKGPALIRYAEQGRLGWNTVPSGNTIRHSRLSFIKWCEGN